MGYTVITGASSGIGYEAALAFAARGENLILAARRLDKLQELKKKIHDQYPDIKVDIQSVDLTNIEQVYSFYESLSDYELDTFINNAGFGHFGSIGEQDLSKIGDMLHLNIEALTILSTLFVRDYEQVEGAQLINISSRAGYTVVGNAVTYSATKFYVSAFTEGLALELKGKGAKLQAKVLAPSATESEFAKRSLDVDEFEYEGNFKKYHTSKEMAACMLELYDSEKTVGIVDGKTFEFELKDPVFSHAGTSMK
ncbi:SDR family NAD(P)-dependent oxidoreductase [Bacillus safensis]|uniref:SDR family NAD(P)-dependent oxidoreductase n=1 Tax=Bacillus safensis TaxID=561879 RepID=UPI00223831EB|nr:SDR family NAD(P)-dependent oxidoreductase [Bacillus safensis]MCW4645551.1 SDR family NAD(P)-dependent oxidoreductase [Bacillus safensis]MCY7565207.1 SDR family NAD(P)-dependent oxidoreductase [Bacillus safensis]MCY7627148.1 SDR family NAD(P)-dependent oxidoreductase [Bacillus safensis]MCY7634578.1 SDR family NAD(P)-dependent oxidoreductase [Bacillus safensis]MCY7649805.1 SDR family NAD(P)-dependent oxidoreductase [Bacillus safensis]